LRRPAPSGRIPKLPTARILIIDDDAQVAQALKRLLRHHEVEIALDGATALARLRDAVFDVVLSDVMMPAPSGIDVYRTLAVESPALLERFIFITGGAHDLAARTFLRAIPNPCLDKPADPVELVCAIAKVLRAGAHSSGLGR
jgi:CheY-like chemotaxis protein